MFGKKRQESSDIFLDVENMELEVSLLSWRLRAWSKVHEPAAVVRCEFRDGRMKLSLC